MRTRLLALLTALTTLTSNIAGAQASKYPPIERYLMPRDAEIALARTAAPANISDRATIKILTRAGFTVARQGENGNVCMVMRGFSAPTYTPAPFRDLVYDPTVRAPICFTAPAAKTAMPYYELRTKLAIEGKDPGQIAAALKTAYGNGTLPRRDGATFAYMWSAHQHLASGIDAWHPHVMIFVPEYDNSMVGGNAFGSPLPQVSDDAGTPFTVVVIPVDDKLAVRLPANH
ncbi:MAG TPA: hypothetical protein VKA54_12135 [Gemmatimonadaceae bacterium]|nr:hypothetical protein [Gemmatimonadaceae bacterium]